MGRDMLAELCEEGLTQRAIAERLGVSHATVRYWLKRHGLRTDGRPPARAWDPDEFATACVESASVAEVLDRIGASKYSGNYRRAALMASELGVVLPVARAGERLARLSKPLLTDDQVLARFVRSATPRDNTSLKRWMTTRLGVQQVCTMCGLGPEWNGKPLTLELDHVDGDRLNNELSNLRLLRLSHESVRLRCALVVVLPDQGMIRYGCERASG